MWTADNARQHADILFDRLVANWQRIGEDIPPLGFLYHTTTEGTETCSVVPEVGNYPKEAVPAFLRMLAEENEAPFVGFASCAHVVSLLEAKEAKAWLSSGRSLSEHPRAVDCLLLTVDGAGLSMMYRAWKENGRMQREVTDGYEYEGRFTNLSGRMGEN